MVIHKGKEKRVRDRQEEKDSFAGCSRSGPFRIRVVVRKAAAGKAERLERQQKASGRSLLLLAAWLLEFI
jgi:hypothetical protein